MEREGGGGGEEKVGELVREGCVSLWSEVEYGEIWKKQSEGISIRRN